MAAAWEQGALCSNSIHSDTIDDAALHEDLRQQPVDFRVGGNRGNEASGDSCVAAVAQQRNHVGVFVFQHVTNL